MRILEGQSIFEFKLASEEVGHDSQFLLWQSTDGSMSLVMRYNCRLLIIKIVGQRSGHWVLIAIEVQRFAIRDKIVTRDEARLEKVVGDEVPFWPIKINCKKW